MKFCKDCKWYGWVDRVLQADECDHPGFETYDLIRGHKILPLCKDMREKGSHCGLAGKLWEPKENA